MFADRLARAVRFSPLLSSIEVVSKIALLHICPEAVHYAVLMPSVVAQVPNIEDAGHSVGFAGSRWSADEDKWHGLFLLPHIQMPGSCLQAYSAETTVCLHQGRKRD